MKKYFNLIIIATIIMFCINGCGKSDGANEKPITDGVQEKELQETISDDNKQDGENDINDNNEQTSNFYAGANLQGSVVSFTNSGIVISPSTIVESNDGGEEMIQAAPGSEESDGNINILYSDDVNFQIVTISVSTLSEISREPTDKETIKKQTEVCVFGECQDTYHWIADEVLILRWR